MILIKAEAQAMAGNVSETQSTLENFVKNSRDPSYVCLASSAEAWQDEIWSQHRIKLVSVPTARCIPYSMCHILVLSSANKK